MKLKLHKTIAFVGMMGAGKTAVGKAVSAKFGVPFLDSDAEIVLAANMSIPEIFERDGEPFFREREAEVINRLLEEGPCILSTGGGAYLQERNRKAISQKGAAVWLDADLELLWSRVKHKDTRPLLRTVDPYATLSELYEIRTPIYALADVRVKASSGLTIDNMADRVVEAICQYNNLAESV